MASASNHPSQTHLLAAQRSKPLAPAPAASSAFYHLAVAWFHGLSIEERGLTGFNLVFVRILIVGAISYQNMSILLDNRNLDGRSHEVIILLTTIDAAMSEAEDAQRRCLVTGETSYLEHYKKVVRQEPAFTAYLGELIRDPPDQQQRAGLLERMMEQQLNAESTAIARFQEDGFRAAETRYTIVLLSIGALLQTALLAWVYCFVRHDITERRPVTGEL